MFLPQAGGEAAAEGDVGHCCPQEPSLGSPELHLQPTWVWEEDVSESSGLFLAAPVGAAVPQSTGGDLCEERL